MSMERVVEEQELLKQIIEILEEKLTELKHHISEYEKLFHKDNILLINNTSRLFFSNIKKLYWDYFTIKACAMMDEAETGRRLDQNLTIPRIVLLAKALKKELAIPHKSIKQINVCIAEINVKLKPFRAARNKVMGHYDLNVFIDKEEMATLNLDELNHAIKNIEVIFHIVKSYLGLSTSIYNMAVTDGATAIIHHLNNGLRFKNERLALFQKDGDK